jgi:predicted nucleic acid-binding protein
MIVVSDTSALSNLALVDYLWLLGLCHRFGHLWPFAV